MRTFFFTVFFVSIFSFYNSVEALGSDSLGLNAGDPKLVANHRILAKVNGKAITLYDVMKKMDMGFYRYFPQYSSSIVARYQYYMVNWRDVFDELVRKELLLADAQENKIEISNGDVREEMEYLFGPNIIANLDKAGMNFDEAFKIIQGDLIIRRIIGARVTAKVIRLVTPAKVRQAYEDFIKDPQNARLTIWHYQVISVRDRTPEKAEELALKIHQMLTQEHMELDKLTDVLKERNLLGRKTKVTISAEIQNNDRELSTNYKEVFEALDKDSYSTPSAHKSRTDNTTVYRIFYMKDKIPGGMPTFKEMEATLKDQLYDQISEQETIAYLERLKQHFHLRDADLEQMIPKDYEPFQLELS